MSVVYSRVFCFQAEDGIRDLVRSRGLGDVYKRQLLLCFFLLAYEPYKRREGELTAWVLVIHPVSRFLLSLIHI